MRWCPNTGLAALAIASSVAGLSIPSSTGSQFAASRSQAVCLRRATHTEQQRCRHRRTCSTVMQDTSTRYSARVFTDRTTLSAVLVPGVQEVRTAALLYSLFCDGAVNLQGSAGQSPKQRSFRQVREQFQYGARVHACITMQLHCILESFNHTCCFVCLCLLTLRPNRPYGSGPSDRPNGGRPYGSGE